MKTNKLTGALLDYWTARAEGTPADQLEIRTVQRPGDPSTPDTICVWRALGAGSSGMWARVDYSTNWGLSVPLLIKTGGVDERCRNGDLHDIYWQAPPGYDEPTPSTGDTPLIAICRAVVRAAFGDEVEDLP